MRRRVRAVQSEVLLAASEMVDRLLLALYVLSVRVSGFDQECVAILNMLWSEQA